MDDDNCLLLEGYLFTLKGCCRSKGKTAMIVGVKGDGSAASPLTSWLFEVYSSDKRKADDLTIISCEKRKGNGPWIPAEARNTTYELTGDIGISGITIGERVSSFEEDPETEFRIIFDKGFDCGGIRIAYISGEDVFCSDNVITPMPPESCWLTPLKKAFCLYLVVSDGYKPEGTCKINVSITKRAAYLVHERGAFCVENGEDQTIKAVKTNIIGNIKVFVSLPLKNSHACGDPVETSACDCFDLNETVCYSDEGNADIRDISVYPDRKSFELTQLNSRCGKSVYRLDGIFIIDSKN
jgi:hypothetical protein